jgi:hypothetical protein
MHSTNTSNPVDFPSWEEMSTLEQYACQYWDMHKDAYGFRPRHIDTSAWTLEQFEAEFRVLGMAIADAEIERQALEQKASFEFEARVQTLMGAGAKDRATALRWIHEAEGSNGDDEYLCFLVGVPYGYFKITA